MRHFRIRNWEKFQHYKQRNPPWIRLYQSLLRDRRLHSLPDACRYHLVGLFLLASQTGNSIPEDMDWLKHELAAKSPIQLKLLHDSGWIEYEEEDASTLQAEAEMLARRKQAASAVPLRGETDNSDSSEADTERIGYGEFGCAFLTADEHRKLKERLNGSLEVYINRFDRWVSEAPNAKANGVKRKDRNAYKSILNWCERDGKGVATMTPVLSEAEQDAKRLAEINRTKPK